LKAKAGNKFPDYYIMQKYTCPCCGYKTIEREDTFYDLCPVCFWETDPYQLANPHYKGGANAPSLAEAQQNFILFGACEKEDVPKIRMPLPDEIKDENFHTFDAHTEGSLFFKRHWDETTGNPKTNEWGKSFYYFQTDTQGNVLKQIIVYDNGKILKYSPLHIEDEFGGLSEIALDLTDKGYEKIGKNTFFTLWNKSKIDSFSKHKIHFSGWHLPVFKEKIIYPNPEFKDDETLITATLDNRFALDLSYQKGGEHFPKNGFFLLKIKEGNTWIHYFNYMSWEETVAVSQKWIDEIQVANKVVDARKKEEEKPYYVRVNIDNQIVIAKLTTWRNMDWEVEKFRNIQIEVRGEIYSIIDTFTDYENMLLALQKSLPKNHQIETCFFCRFSCYSVYGNDNFGALMCLKNDKDKFLNVKDKDDFIDFQDEMDSVIFVEETHYCNEFQLIEGNDWAYKNQIKN
jgi:Cysteine-rich CPCC